MELIRTTAHLPARCNSKTLIQTFPSELLLIIFKLAYRAARGDRKLSCPCSTDPCATDRTCYCCGERSEDSDDYYDERLPPLALFPDSVASVCSRWRELMLLVPIFWTRLVVSLDTDAFPPPDLKRRLDSSADHPLDIIVTRTSFLDAVGLKDVEQSRMGQIITALRSNFHRCRTLRLEVVHSSSLPRLLAVLPSNMPHLRTLSLKGHLDSGRPGVQPYCLLDRATPFNSGRLHTIVLDGWNFSDLDKQNPSADGDIFSNCHLLSLKFGEIPTASLGRLVEDCPLNFLDIDSVTFTEEYNMMDIPNLIKVTLKNLNAEAMERIIDFASYSPRRLTIDNCPLPPVSLETLADVLDLRNIGLNHGLEHFIAGWIGTDLVVTGCPGFDDSILKAMGRLDDDDGYPQAERMELLIVEDCHGFSVDALKGMIQIRASSAVEECTPLARLVVKKARVTLSDEDFRWFGQNLTSFWWGV